MNNIKKQILDNAKGLSLALFFDEFECFFGFIRDDPSIKDKFFDFLVELIKLGELKLASSDGVFLKGTPEEQVDLFRQAWPDEYDPSIPEKDIDYLWWWVAAPAGAVWIYHDGFEEWT